MKSRVIRDQLHTVTMRQFWFAADVTRKAAKLEPLGIAEARDLYLTYRDAAVRAELRAVAF